MMAAGVGAGAEETREIVGPGLENVPGTDVAIDD